MDLEASTYHAAEVKEEPWTGPDLLVQPILPILGDAATKSLEVGESSTVREPHAPVEETVPKPIAPEVTIPGPPAVPWAVEAQSRYNSSILNIESVSEDPTIALGLLKMLCLPVDMAELPTDSSENLSHMFASISRVGQDAIGVRDLLFKSFQICKR